MEKMKKNQLIFISVFTVIGLIALQIPFTRLLGSNVRFTLFDLIAPTAGAFIGTIPGIISVFLMQSINIAIHGATLANLGGFIRLFPTLFAVAYFAKKRTINIIIPLLCILVFNLNPIGRSAWQYSLFWLIPIAAHFFRKNPANSGAGLFIKSLGATFTAHAVGGAAWVWAFGLTKEIWLALIPQVIMERIIMAAGITVSYLALVKVFNFLKAKKVIAIPAISASN